VGFANFEIGHSQPFIAGLEACAGRRA